MTFTYTPASPDDTTRVRWHIGDTDELSLIMTDEDIAFALANSASWKVAVIACIDYIITQLARESGVTLDWLKVEREAALKYYTQLKRDKKSEFGLVGGSGTVSASATYTTRRDVPS